MRQKKTTLQEMTILRGSREIYRWIYVLHKREAYNSVLESINKLEIDGYLLFAKISCSKKPEPPLCQVEHGPVSAK